jgi:dTDP-4-amino-4,6-dideoxygalactose transaminase
MEALWALARRHGLVVVEDAAQAHGAAYRGRSVGGLGTVAAFSFYPTKNVGALGDAGAVCTDDPDIAARAPRLRNLGQRRKGEHVELGANERLDGLQAAFLRAKLPHLAAANRARRDVAATYRSGLAGVTLLEERDHTPSVNHLFPIRLARRDVARTHLLEHGVETGIHYPCPAHRHPAWIGRLEPPAQEFPVACAWAREELSLPMFAELRASEVERVIEACAELPSLGCEPADPHTKEA